MRGYAVTLLCLTRAAPIPAGNGREAHREDKLTITSTQANRLVALIGIAVGAIILGACSSRASPSSRSLEVSATTSSSTPAGSEITSVAGQNKYKPVLTGLIDMGIQTSYGQDQPFPTVNISEITPYVGDFSGIVVNENWSQLETSQGVYAWGDLDESLAAVTQFNQAHPNGQVYVKLRIFGGNGAPDWAKNLGGSPISEVLKQQTRTYGRWWTPAYRAAWNTFQHAMAARYDSNPLIRAVSVGSCASSTGEPFVLNPGKAALTAIESAGWTVAAQESCLEGAISDYSGWKTTPIEFAFNPFENVVGTKLQVDQNFTSQIMEQCIGSGASGGPECIPGNNALSDATLLSRVASIYDEIDTLWQESPGSFQTYFQTVGASVDCQAISLGISYHATAIELWPPDGRLQGYSAIPSSTLAQWNEALKSGSQLTCS